jgi:orotidine-5'-phosphate decarboxylase
MKPHERIILPLDVSDITKATQLVNDLASHVGVFKVGFEAIYSTMAELISHPEQDAVNYLKRVRRLATLITKEKAFLDVKLADIPNTVGNAVRALSQLGVKMINIHASAGEKVIKAAVENKGKSLLFGVTVLTSISDHECLSIFGAIAQVKVYDFACMLIDNGADGIICAPKEGLKLREGRFFDKLLIATPNVRPLWAAGPDDQNKERQMTPGEAIKAGIDMLVIGRPITKPPAEVGGPVEAAKRIAFEIEQANGGAR